MSYLSFENNIIEASGNLILKSNGDTIDCCGCNLINVSNITSSGSGNTTSFNSDVAIEGNLTIDGSLVIQTGDTTLIHTKDLDISDNIIGLNRGNTSGMGKNTSGMLINYFDASNIFFGYHNDPSINAFVIADTSYNHDDDSRNIVLDKYVNLKVGIVYCSDNNDNESRFATVNSSLYIQNDNQINFTSKNDTYSNSNYGIQIDILNGEHKCKGNIDVSGQVTANSFNATSDYRTKTSIEDLDENITVSNLRPLVYLKNGKKEIGLIAHELQEVYPFMVCGEKDGKEMQSVNYIGLIGVLINDVKRLTNENQILKLNNDTLKSDYDTLKSENNDIKSRLDSLEEKFNKKFE